MKENRNRLVGMSTVRNEGDVLREVMEYALRSHDCIYVVDWGSEDETPLILSELARRWPALRFLGTIEPAFAEQIRWQIWSRFRSDHSFRDWWSIVDADEFFHDDPREVIQRAVAEGADHIMVQHVEFYYKKLEYLRWLENHESLADRARSITERL